jgi:hypothetical protein
MDRLFKGRHFDQEIIVLCVELCGKLGDGVRRAA